MVPIGVGVPFCNALYGRLGYIMSGEGIAPSPRRVALYKMATLFRPKLLGYDIIDESKQGDYNGISYNRISFVQVMQV